MKHVLSIADAFALAFFLVLVKLCFATRRRPPLPPGPRGLPILGNLLQLTPTNAWVTYHAGAKVYGDVFSLTLPGSNVLVVNSVSTAKSLLDKHAAAYAGRPLLPFAELSCVYLRGSL